MKDYDEHESPQAIPHETKTMSSTMPSLSLPPSLAAHQDDAFSETLDSGISGC